MHDITKRADTYHTLTLLTQDRVKEHFVLNQYINTTQSSYFAENGIRICKTFMIKIGIW